MRYNSTIILIFLIVVSCSHEENKNDDNLVIEDPITIYFGTYKRTSAYHKRIDTVLFERKIINDTIVAFSYKSLDDTNSFLLDPIHLRIDGNKVLGLINITDQVNYDSIYIVDHKGDSILLLESEELNPPIDGDGIHVISLKYGVILSYARSWGNYYYIIETSNDKATKRIYELQRIYLMTKNRI